MKRLTLTFLALVMWASVAEAQAETQVVLARAAVGECGWLLPDCEAALWHTLLRRTVMVLRRQRPAYTLQRMVLKYCAVFRGKHQGRRVWIRLLQPDGEQPNGWPARSQWEKHRPWWNDVYARAGDFLAGKVKDPCKGKPIHTGGLVDRARMNPEDWQEVDCGRTRSESRAQFFWERRKS